MNVKATVSLMAAILLAACGEQQVSSPSVAPGGNPPATPNLQRVACSARVDTKVVKCGQLESAGVSGDIIVGKQNIYVTLTANNVVYTAVDSTFQFDVSVTNLIPQSMGTDDGVTPDSLGNGVRVFFETLPTVTGGTGTASVRNADGTDTFLTSNTPYFKYSASTPPMLGADGILEQNEMSDAKTWQLTVDPTVTSFTFYVYVSAPVHNPGGYVTLTRPSPYLNTTQSQAIAAESFSAVGNPYPSSTFTYVSTDPAVATVDASGNVSALTPGTTYIRVTSSESTTDSVTVQVCPTLAVGDVYTTSGAAAASTCLGGYPAAAEFTAMPYNSGVAATSLTVTGSNIQAVTGPPSPNRIPNATLMQLSSTPSIESTYNGSLDVGLAAEGANLVREVAYATRIGGPHADEDVPAEAPMPPDEGVLPASGGKQRLMWHPTESANGRVAASTELAPNTVTPTALATKMSGTPSVGDLVSYNVASGCSGARDERVGMVRSVSARAVIVSDTANPAGGFTTAQYDSIALEHDTVAYTAITSAFGTPTDLDSNGGRTVMFFTRAVNELSPPASSQVTLGYHQARDAQDSVSCTRSNVAEIMYMLVPDPTGAVNSNVRTVSFVRGSTTGTSGSNLAKIISSFTRQLVTHAPAEEQWLELALGNMAEELMFYRTSVGLAPKSNIQLSSLTTGPNASRRVAAFNNYANQNFGRFRAWLQRPDTAGVGKPTSGSQAVMGTTWAFLRYATDRMTIGDSSFISQIVNSPTTGMASLTNVIGAPATDWVRDYIVAMYADDNAFSVASQYTTPSWNFRSVFGGLGGFPLLARPLTDNTALTLSYQPGGTAYTRVGVAASSFATITVKNGINDPGAQVYWTIIRTK